jgi:hypothetical protein
MAGAMMVISILNHVEFMVPKKMVECHATDKGLIP